jgi:hypothetical protein
MIIAQGLVPPLYQSGVVYQEEPADQGFESFDDAHVCYQRGWADCDDLGAWRCAELRESGENANIRITWMKHPTRTGRLYHVTVRRADGTIEDPSKKLGMPTFGKQEFTRGPRRVSGNFWA